MFSFLILKIKLYKHHYLSIITVLILGILFDLILGKFNKKNIVNDVVSFVTEILFKFIKSYEILFYEGIIESILGILTLIITTDIGYIDNFNYFIIYFFWICL